MPLMSPYFFVTISPIYSIKKAPAGMSSMAIRPHILINDGLYDTIELEIELFLHNCGGAPFAEACEFFLVTTSVV